MRENSINADYIYHELEMIGTLLIMGIEGYYCPKGERPSNAHVVACFALERLMKLSEYISKR